MKGLKTVELKRLIPRVLKMDPTKIGVERLCQELLAELYRLENKE